MDIAGFFDGEGRISPQGWDALGKQITYPSQCDIWGVNFSAPSKKELRRQNTLPGKKGLLVLQCIIEDDFVAAVIHDAVAHTDATESELRTKRMALVDLYNSGHTSQRWKKSDGEKAVNDFELKLRTFAGTLTSARIQKADAPLLETKEPGGRPSAIR